MTHRKPLRNPTGDELLSMSREQLVAAYRRNTRHWLGAENELKLAEAEIEELRRELDAQRSVMTTMQDELDTANEALELLDPQVKKGERHVVLGSSPHKLP